MRFFLPWQIISLSQVSMRFYLIHLSAMSNLSISKLGVDLTNSALTSPNWYVFCVSETFGRRFVLLMSGWPSWGIRGRKNVNCIFSIFLLIALEANVLGMLEFEGKQGVWMFPGQTFCVQKKLKRLKDETRNK